MIQKPPPRPKVFIVGGGFAGLAAAQSLAKADFDVILFDQRNHHLFQPLLYQVAAAALSPADIASPIRRVLRKQKNCQVALAKVRGVDLVKRQLLFRSVGLEYDWLILAAGATQSWFGHPEWAQIAPGLKTLEDATALRNRILLAFESAEYEGDEPHRKAALTFAIVGGGPTGVELAGAIQEIAARGIPADFRNVDTTTTRVILIEGDDRLLSQYHPKLSARAKSDLEEMGVEVLLNTRVTNITLDGVFVGETFIAARNVFWAAGVQGSPLGKSLEVPLDRAGRVVVGPDLAVLGDPRVFVIGDMAAATSAKTGLAVPGVAPAAMQMGKYVGQIISQEAHSKETAPRLPFSYKDKGSMATIGKDRAVAQIGKFSFAGRLAWLLWAVIHIISLVSFRNRFVVALSWTWYWVSYSRGARLITGEAELAIRRPRSMEGLFQHEKKEPQP